MRPLSSQACALRGASLLPRTCSLSTSYSEKPRDRRAALWELTVKLRRTTTERNALDHVTHEALASGGTKCGVQTLKGATSWGCLGFAIRWPGPP